MYLKKKNKIRALAATLLGILLISFLGCGNNSGPLSGCYKIKGQNKYAVILDSTLNIMCGFDTAFIYDLKYKDMFVLNDSTIIRFYGVLFSNSLNRSGYGNVECPLQFGNSESFGGLPIVIFENYDSFYIGDYYFEKQSDSAELIFDKWVDLYTNNRETRLLMQYQE